MDRVKITDEKDVFLIQSHSNDTIWYKVNIVSQSCSCPHYRIRLQGTNMTCKHYNDLMKYLNVEIKNKEPTFKEIEVEIRLNNNYIEWDKISDKYGDEVIEEMIRLGKLIQLKRGFLSVLE